MAKRSAAQQERQIGEYRSGGRYAKVNPCEVCKKSAGINYLSDERVNTVGKGRGLVLCRGCAKKLLQLDDEGFKAILGIK